MASITITKWIILSINILIIQTLTLTHAQQVPCFFIFGDSQMDNGNNNLLPTSAKANYRPYGIDFPGAVPTGRFTNGKNIADFLGIIFLDQFILPLCPQNNITIVILVCPQFKVTLNLFSCLGKWVHSPLIYHNNIPL